MIGHVPSLRIVHACNFHYNKCGEKFDTMDARVHHGLVENGHYVYPFPVHDIARQFTWTSSKRVGAAKANQALVATCAKIRPDILLLGHSQTIRRKTLEQIRETAPEIRIAQWFCDWFYSKRLCRYEFIYDRLDLLDAFFATTAGEKLASFNRSGCRTAFIPNLVHPAIDKYQVFKQTEFDYDIVFIGSDRKDPARRAMLGELEEALGKRFQVGFFGCLDRPGVYGHEKERLLSRSKAGLNLSRIPEPMKWYSSDRIASLLGNGLLTCTDAVTDLHELYGPDSMIYYRDTDDLIRQLDEALAGNAWRTIAECGWLTSHGLLNSRRITALMIDFVFERRKDCLNLDDKGEKHGTE